MAVASDTPLPRSSFSHSDNFMQSLLAIRERQSIAFREFHSFVFRYPIEGMKTVGQTRRENLLLLLEKHGSLANLNEKLGLLRTDATLSQIKNQSRDSKTGKPKMMGPTLARRIEQALALPTGWMDNDQLPPSYRQQRIAHAVKAMEGMTDYQLDQTVKVVDTLAEPAEKNDTTD